MNSEMTDKRVIARINRANLMPVFAAAGMLLLVLAGIAMVIYNEQSYREGKVRQIEAQSRILASTVAAALSFNDRKAAQEYVTALGVDPQIRIAAVYDASGELFALLSRTQEGQVPRTANEGDSTIQGNYLAVSTPVRQANTLLGTVYLQTTIEPITRRFERYVVIGLLVALAAMIFMLLGVGQKKLTAANERLKLQGLDLAQANNELRAQIEQRERVETALRQAQKMEAMGQLTGGIAHDFNNLLQVIIGNLEVVQRRDLAGNDNARRLVLTAVRSAERAAVLTQRLLAFARRQPLDPKPLDVNKLVTAMSDLLHRTLGESIRIETVLAGGIWRVAVDGNQLENALLNLAVNARDAMPAGGKLTIETANASLDDAYAAANEVKPGQFVCVAVTDTGTGMPQEVLAKAFEPFFTTKDVGKGSGLGLSQVYGFIKQSDGHVKIYSEQDEGTTVKLYLPRLPVAKDGSEAATESQALPVGQADRTILMVEDDEDVRAHAVMILRELGYFVLEAADGANALRILESTSPIHLLFTDVGLPGGMNGRQLADKALANHPDLMVLFTTGYARNAIVHQGRLDAGVDLITKPFTYAALAVKVHGIFERRAGQQSVRAT
jgi:signal transduction histidine kinase